MIPTGFQVHVSQAEQMVLQTKLEAAGVQQLLRPQEGSRTFEVRAEMPWRLQEREGMQVAALPGGIPSMAHALRPLTACSKLGRVNVRFAAGYARGSRRPKDGSG